MLLVILSEEPVHTGKIVVIENAGNDKYFSLYFMYLQCVLVCGVLKGVREQPRGLGSLLPPFCGSRQGCESIVPKEPSPSVSFKSSGHHLLFLWGELVPLDN